MPSAAALLHLPPGTKPGERLPCVISVQGMDAVKEEIALYCERRRYERVFSGSSTFAAMELQC